MKARLLPFFCPPHRRLGAIVLVVLLVPLAGAQTNAPSAPAASTNAPAAPAPVTIPQSVFDPKVRKDPFFPGSTRLNPAPIHQGGAATSAAATKAKDPLEALRLNGITGSKRRRFASISGVTFGVQEEATVRVGSTNVLLKVLEIRDRSVLVTIDGGTEPKEIFLKED